jgi:hypothetical protein
MAFCTKSSDNLQRGIEEELYRPDIDVDVMARYRIESVMLPFNAALFFQTTAPTWFILNNKFLNIFYTAWPPQRAKADSEIQNATNKKMKQMKVTLLLFLLLFCRFCCRHSSGMN